MHECAVEDVLGPPEESLPDMSKLIARKGYSGRTISVEFSKHGTQLELYVLRREPRAEDKHESPVRIDKLTPHVKTCLPF